MGIFDRLRGKKEAPPKELVLKNLQAGWLVDYDLTTWEVKAYNTYRWGSDQSHEWQLANQDSVRYLELEQDDRDDWSFNQKLPFKELDPSIRQAILDNGDPPEEIIYQGRTYYLEEMAGGHFFKDARGEGQELLRWSYSDNEGENYLGIEQWGENDFEASLGVPVEEYQFTNILPRE